MKIKYPRVMISVEKCLWRTSIKSELSVMDRIRNWEITERLDNRESGLEHLIICSDTWRG